MKIRIISLVSTVLLLSHATLLADDLPKAEKWENVNWYVMVFMKFKPGKIYEAEKFIEEHWVPVDEAAERTGIFGYDIVFGTWDSVVFFPLDGPEMLNWKITPQDEKWWVAWVEHAGSMEDSTALFEEWNALVHQTEVTLVRRRLD